MCAERCRCPKIGCCSFLLVEWCQGMSVRWNVQSFFPVAAADTQTVLVALLEAEDWLLLAGVAPSSDGHIPFLVTYQPAAFPGIFSLNLQWKCLVFSWHIGGSTVVFPYMGAAFSRLRLILWNTRKNPRFLWLDYFLCFASYFLVVSTLPQRLYLSLTRDNIFSLWLHYALLILPVFQRAWDFLLNRSYSTLAEGGWCQFYLNLGFLKDRLYGLINLPRCHSLTIPRQKYTKPFLDVVTWARIWWTKMDNQLINLLLRTTYSRLAGEHARLTAIIHSSITLHHTPGRRALSMKICVKRKSLTRVIGTLVYFDRCCGIGILSKQLDGFPKGSTSLEVLDVCWGELVRRIHFQLFLPKRARFPFIRHWPHVNRCDIRHLEAYLFWLIV